MSFDANSLLVSLLFSSFGFVFFAYGKKQSRLPHMIAGVALAIASNLLLVILLNHPLSGVMPVSPDAYQSVIVDLTP